MDRVEHGIADDGKDWNDVCQLVQIGSDVIGGLVAHRQGKVERLVSQRRGDDVVNIAGYG